MKLTRSPASQLPCLKIFQVTPSSENLSLKRVKMLTTLTSFTPATFKPVNDNIFANVTVRTPFAHACQPTRLNLTSLGVPEQVSAKLASGK